MTTRSIMVFSRFERFWHWSQVALIFTLLITGFAIRGLHQMVSFETAVTVHTWSAIGLVVLWVFAIFWHLTTGTWRHYLPTTNGLLRVAKFYAFGIFKGEHHPYKKSYLRKHNPLQALAYLALKLFLFPAIWISGIAYLFYSFWRDASGSGSILEWVSTIHVGTAFLILVFIIAHLYLLTTGHTVSEHVKPMITGYDDVDLSEAEEAFLQESKTVSMK